MDIDPMETVEQLNEPADDSQDKKDQVSHQLNIWVAITVALLATFMGICKVKDDNIVQAMQQSQANKIDHWAFYQARNMREELAKSTELQLRLAAKNVPADQKAEYQAAIDSYAKLAREQHEKKDELKKQAEQDQVDYDNANYKDDQFDLSDALLAIAISLLAVTALTKQRWLYFVALVPTGFGVLMGLAGLLGWHIHPTALVALLS
ncbi:DUF4337 domain-containing protein [Undibacterium sp. TS12]|uniref:DUF4337 domain-containing protein n=1 Tax=Undibacterium sp. TS12 TaxID=2908202 RepID=UPI001F4C62D9|nr:DUF4337 domain-containing protein [Undibacterium sp. TS12]MCH8619440.1 DUF4337 domain-containing protein [Undibacterium sp. TS12]